MDSCDNGRGNDNFHYSMPDLLAKEFIYEIADLSTYA